MIRLKNIEEPMKFHEQKDINLVVLEIRIYQFLKQALKLRQKNQDQSTNHWITVKHLEKRISMQ